MHTPLCPARRRGRARRLRLVDPAQKRVLNRFEAEALDVGLHGLCLLRKYYPEFFAQHAAALPATVDGMIGACTAFWRLVENQYGVDLSWPKDECDWMDSRLKQSCRNTPPEELLTSMEAGCEWMAQIYPYLSEPRPTCYGIGVLGLLDYGSNPADLSLGTLLLWHLFRDSAWSIAVSNEVLGRLLDHTNDLVQAQSYRPLPRLSAEQVQAVCAVVSIPEAEAHGVTSCDLIGFAFGQTSTDIANYSDYEVEHIFFHEIEARDWRWENCHNLAEQQRLARRLQLAYLQWSTRMGASETDLRQFVAQLRRAARRVLRDKPPVTLYEMATRGAFGSLVPNIPAAFDSLMPDTPAEHCVQEAE